VVRESDGSVRLAFGIHTMSERFRELTRHPDILLPAKQLLGGDVYVHQSKIVSKSPQAGQGFPWHQDYTFWRRRDRIPTDRLLSAIIFLDEVRQTNGPIYVVAGSHTKGLVDEEAYAIDADGIKSFCPPCTLEVPIGPLGSVVFLHSMVIHGSPPNISPHERMLGFVTYNRIDNAPPQFDEAQPDYISAREHEALKPLAEKVDL
jgi:ectoine hydroxylase